MGKYDNITLVKDLNETITAMLDDYFAGIKEPIQDALSGAADIYIKHAVEQNKKVLKSTKDEEHRRVLAHMVDSWSKYSKSKYPLQIYVGNKRKFHYEDRDELPAINIAEYGTCRGLPVKPILGPAMDAAAGEILDYIASVVEKEL